MWSKLTLDHVTLGNYHLTYHMFSHVTLRHLGYHVIYQHVILGKYHMTYQGIGHLHDHMHSHDHLIVHVSDARLVC